MLHQKSLLATVALMTGSLPSLVSAWSFNIADTPLQCGNISIAITDGTGTAPYSVLIIPFGSSPLPNNVEARKIQAVNFTGSDTSVSFKLNYPFNSQFVAVVSDSTAFGAGGTSGAVTVQNSGDSSCFDASANVSPDFVYSIVPANQIVQCQSTRIWWDPTTVSGTPQFQGVIPGGDSFSIPEGSLTTVTNQGIGFSWIPAIREGSTLLLVGGDDRGLGTAGSTLYAVGAGTSQDNSCLNSTSPSSTAGHPAGGSYPTTTNTASSSSSGGGSSINTAAIAGGVVGGIFALLALLLVILFLFRRRRFHRQQQKPDVDLIQDAGDGNQRDHHLPQYYQPEPFIVPDPTLNGSSAHGHSLDYTRPSTEGSTRPLSSGTYSSSGPEMSMLGGAQSSVGSARKGGAPRPMRPVNVIQHDDAGPSDGVQEEAETVELPPAYTNIKKPGASRLSASYTPQQTSAEIVRRA